MIFLGRPRGRPLHILSVRQIVGFGNAPLPKGAEEIHKDFRGGDSTRQTVLFFLFLFSNTKKEKISKKFQIFFKKLLTKIGKYGYNILILNNNLKNKGEIEMIESENKKVRVLIADDNREYVE